MSLKLFLLTFLFINCHGQSNLPINRPRRLPCGTSIIDVDNTPNTLSSQWQNKDFFGDSPGDKFWLSSKPSFILAGTAVPEGKYPWQVSLQINRGKDPKNGRDNLYPFCG